jgi:hypothetical protein
MPHPLAIAAALYGGYRGYRGAKDAGASGLGRLFGAAAGAYGGYNLAGMVPGVSAPSPMSLFSSKAPINPRFLGTDKATGGMLVPNPNFKAPTNPQGLDRILNILKSEKDGEMVYSPAKVSAAIAGATYLSGAFDNQPTDIFMPGYNLSYLDLKEQRPGYTYIDPTTGNEVAYQKMYSPEEAGKEDRRIGPYSMVQQRLKEGGIAEVKKFNEGGVNYLPSKMTHDENDSNNYVRATGYVEDGAGVGDKDEDTMLAQLADGEFVTRADGVLGAGIIAGANPNSMKDMREKGAEYFYEQQRRYKRVFDLLKDRNGDSKQKIN